MPQFDPPPELLGDLTQRWGLLLDPPLGHDGMTAWVARARRGGEPCVLKIAELHDEGLHEADGLRVWDGAGAVRLLDSAVAGTVTALLIESCEPGGQLMGAMAAERQDEVLAGLTRRLWVTPPPGHPFRP